MRYTKKKTKRSTCSWIMQNDVDRHRLTSAPEGDHGPTTRSTYWWEAEFRDLGCQHGRRAHRWFCGAKGGCGLKNMLSFSLVDDVHEARPFRLRARPGASRGDRRGGDTRSMAFMIVDLTFSRSVPCRSILTPKRLLECHGVGRCPCQPKESTTHENARCPV